MYLMQRTTVTYVYFVGASFCQEILSHALLMISSMVAIMTLACVQGHRGTEATNIKFTQTTMVSLMSLTKHMTKLP